MVTSTQGLESSQEHTALIYETYGEVGPILVVFSTVDPLRCFYGWDVNPDEYLTKATATLRGIQEAKLFSLSGLTPEMLEEAVRRSFGITEIGDGWVTLETIKKIAQMLYPLYIRRDGPGA